MPFVCVLPARSFDVSRNGNKFAVVFRVGYDDAMDLNYFAMVGLGGAPDGMEYYFCIIKVDGSDQRETRIWRGSELPADCTKQNRTEILSAILAATEHLLRDIAPRTVHRVMDANLPDNALAKHRAVSQIFTSCGYRLAREHTDGRFRVLRMER